MNVSVEEGFAKLKRSSITWAASIVVPLCIVGALNAQGLYLSVQATKDQIVRFQVSQQAINDKQGVINEQLMTTGQQQAIINQRLSDRLDSLQQLIESMKK